MKVYLRCYSFHNSQKYEVCVGIVDERTIADDLKWTLTNNDGKEASREKHRMETFPITILLLLAKMGYENR